LLTIVDKKSKPAQRAEPHAGIAKLAILRKIFRTSHYSKTGFEKNSNSNISHGTVPWNAIVFCDVTRDSGQRAFSRRRKRLEESLEQFDMMIARI
jgi:hypothetical protein